MLRKFIFQPGLVTDGCLSRDPANEEIEGVYKKTLREGEERLMLAVLESAVEDFQKYVLARNPSEQKPIYSLIASIIRLMIQEKATPTIAITTATTTIQVCIE